MKRDVQHLTSYVFDVLVIGAGIYGATLANEAAQRGLSVAVIDKADFGGATSANSLKTIHGGLRYLQQLDFTRMRESIRERRAMLRVAPHLVHPLPVAVPTYGHGLKGKEVMSLALLANDTISADRNRQLDAAHTILPGRTVSRREALRLLPGIREEGLTGAAIFYDAQAYNSERLTLAFVQSAVLKGAVAANYVEATGLVRQVGRVVGVHARDVLTCDTFDIRARMTVITAGPWVDRLSTSAGDQASQPPQQYAKAIDVITRPIFETYAVGVSGRTAYRDADALIDKGNRLYFLSPWRDRTLVGTAYYPCTSDPDSFAVTPDEVESFLANVNEACPGAALRPSDVLFVHQGLLPMTGLHPRTGDVQLSKAFRLRDEGNGLASGLITVTGVKYTTARNVAQRVVSRVYESWGQRAPASLTASTPLYGGDIDHYDVYLSDQVRASPCGLSQTTIRCLVMNYGTAYHDVLADCEPANQRQEPEQWAVVRAQVRYAVRVEMAQKLTDVVFRRTDLGSAGHPGNEVLRIVAGEMAVECGWDAARTQRELDDVKRVYAVVPALPSTHTHKDEQTDGTKLADQAVR